MSSGGQTTARTSIPVCRFTSSSAKMFVGSLVATSSVFPSIPTGTMLLRWMKSSSSFLNAFLSTSSGVRRRNSRPLSFAFASRTSLAPTSPSLSSHVVGSIPGRPIDLPAQPAVLLVGDLSQSRAGRPPGRARARNSSARGSTDRTARAPAHRPDRSATVGVGSDPARFDPGGTLTLIFWWDRNRNIIRQLQYGFHFFGRRHRRLGRPAGRPGQLDGVAADLDDRESLDGLSLPQNLVVDHAAAALLGAHDAQQLRASWPAAPSAAGGASRPGPAGPRRRPRS